MAPGVGLEDNIYPGKEYNSNPDPGPNLAQSSRFNESHLIPASACFFKRSKIYRTNENGQKKETLSWPSSSLEHDSILHVPY